MITASGTLPAAPAVPVVGQAESATNGSFRFAILGTVTDIDADFGALGVQVGDRFRFTSGEFAGDGRVVTAVSGDTLTLSGPEFIAAGVGAPVPGAVGEAYEIVRPLCSDGTGGWAPCFSQGGSASTNLFQAGVDPEMMTQARVTVTSAVPPSTACELTWVRSGVDQAGFEYFGNEGRGADASFTVGGDVRVDPLDGSLNLFAPLQQVGDEEIRVLTQGLDPGDYVELQLTPAPAGSCAAGSGCSCFGQSLGGVEVGVTRFAENLVP